MENSVLSRFTKLSGTHRLIEKTNGENIKIMIVDTGIEEDLLINPNKIVYKYNDIKNEEGLSDKANHGTAITSLVQAVAPDSDIYFVKALNGLNKGTPANIYKAITIALSKKVDILCLSLGTNAELSVSTKKVLQSAIRSGMIVVSASGNFNRNYLQNPARVEGVISVGGLNKELDDKWEKSNYNAKMDFVAPAESVETVGISGDIELRNGTSFANAIVVGQIALMMSYLKSKGVPFTSSMLEEYGSNETRKLLTGKGFIDINKFIDKHEGR